MASLGSQFAPAAALGVPTKAEAVYREIRRRILKGEVEPGSQINQEALALEVGLSVTPVREAFRRLEAEGLVRLEAHKTVMVAPLTRRELHEIYNVRLQLDPHAAALACTNASDAEIKQIDQLAKQPALDNPALQLESNRAFHRVVYSASGNRVLTEMLDQLWDRTDRYRLILLSRHGILGPLARKEHVEIAKAIAARQPRVAAKLVRSHVDLTQSLIDKLTEVP